MQLYKTMNLGFTYKLGSQNIQALSNVNFTLDLGCFMCLSGPSGSGKTTLLNILGLISEVKTGTLFFQGTPTEDLSEKEKNRIRRYKLGFIFQTFQLFPILNAYENVEFFLARQGLPNIERKKRCEVALKLTGMWEHRLKRPNEMSGGQQQRVAIARAFAKHPDVLIADEPTASLDQSNGRIIMELLKELNEKQGLSIILSSHDSMVQSFAHKIIQLKDGQLLNG